MTLYNVQIADANPDYVGGPLLAIDQELDDSDAITLSWEISAELRAWRRRQPGAVDLVLRFPHVTPGQQMRGEIYRRGRGDAPDVTVAKWCVTPLDTTPLA